MLFSGCTVVEFDRNLSHIFFCEIYFTSVVNQCLFCFLALWFVIRVPMAFLAGFMIFIFHNLFSISSSCVIWFCARCYNRFAYNVRLVFLPFFFVFDVTHMSILFWLSSSPISCYLLLIDRTFYHKISKIFRFMFLFELFSALFIMVIYGTFFYKSLPEICIFVIDI